MAIAAYVGLPGHGKSYSVVEHVILPALKAGRVVVTNLPVRLDKVREVYPSADVRFFTIDELAAEPDRLLEVAVPGCVFVLDEAQKLWPSGLLPNKTPKSWLSFVTEHRHRVDDLDRSTEVVIVSQDLGNVASFVRKLTEQTYRTVKLVSLGASKRFRVDVYTGPITGPNPPSKNRVRQMMGTYSPKVYGLYKSHTQSEGSGSGAVEGSVDKRLVIWRSPMLWFGAAVAVVMGVGGVWAVVDYFRGGNSAAGDAPPPKVAVAPVGGGARLESRPRAVVSPWRISGEVRINGRAQVWLTNGSQYVVLDEAGYCDRDVGGFLICQWDGAEVTNQARLLPVVRAVREGEGRGDE